jgi:histone H3/H4
MSDNDDDLCIPRSAMYKLVKELVPQVRLSGEAKDLIVTACNEFIHLLASESNNVCEKQSKKLILPDHVLLALDNLGFSEYKDDCVEVMKQMQEETDKRKKLKSKLDKPGIPQEELLRQQNLLFAEARKQQQMIENAEEWSKVQQEAQLALQRQASTIQENNQFPISMGQNASSSSKNKNGRNSKNDDDDDNYD